MSESYVECLVKQKPAVWAGVAKGALMALTVVLVLGGLIFAPLLLAALIVGGGTYFLNLYTDLEYEYLYLDKELVVDKVMAKSRRKRVGSYSVDRMEILAPIKSYHLDSFRNRTVKTRDFSIGEELAPDQRYYMYYEGGERLILSPSEDLVKAIKTVAPRKVYTD